LFSLQKISVSVCIVIQSLNAIAGDPFRPAAGAREAGMAYVSVMKSDLWSCFHNQAGLAYNKSPSFGFNYENRFFLRELGTRSACAVIPVGKTSMGAVYSHFGYTDFKRDMVGISCGMPLSEKISAGIQVDWYSERSTGEYRNFQILTCEAGLSVAPSENVRIGIHLFNPVPNSIRKAEMPSRLRVGAGVNLSRELFAGIEAEMSNSGKADIRTGFEYQAAKQVWFRGGFSSAYSSFSFGFGFMAKPAIIDIAFSTHENLGITSSISIIFKIKSR
jgi:hypothetical protein